VQSRTAVTIVGMLNTFVATHFEAESQTGRKVGSQSLNRRAVAEEGALPLLVRFCSLPGSPLREIRLGTRRFVLYLLELGPDALKQRD